MLREGEKEGKTSWSGGAVHFFCYSFDRLFRKLFRKTAAILIMAFLCKKLAFQIFLHNENSGSWLMLWP